MSKIFKISGNFCQRGKWVKPDPSFVGVILVDDNNEFYGTCTELYPCEICRMDRFLAGAFAHNDKNGELGIAFYKLSNCPEQLPIRYVVPDLTNPETSSWAGFSLIFGTFQKQGKAKITIEEEPYSEEEAANITSRFELLNLALNGNDQLLDQVYCCIDMIKHASET